MFNRLLGDYNTLVLDLYRLSLDSPVHLFQDQALKLVRSRLAFDSSMWGTATHTATGIDIHTIHLHEQPLEMLQAYEAVKHLDTAAVAVSNNPSATLSFNAADWFSHRNQRPLLDYGHRFDQRNFFITSTLNPLRGSPTGSRCSEPAPPLLAQSKRGSCWLLLHRTSSSPWTTTAFCIWLS